MDFIGNLVLFIYVFYENEYHTKVGYTKK